VRGREEAAAAAAEEGAGGRAGLVAIVHQMECRAKKVEAQYCPDLLLLPQARPGQACTKAAISVLNADL
jgi:hypothetical protein